MTDDEHNDEVVCPDCGESHPVIPLTLFNPFEEACKDVDSIVFNLESIMLKEDTVKEIVSRLLPHAIAHISQQMLAEAVIQINESRSEEDSKKTNED